MAETYEQVERRAHRYMIETHKLRARVEKLERVREAAKGYHDFTCETYGEGSSKLEAALAECPEVGRG